MGTVPFEDLEVDFTEVKPCQGYQYVLVLLCTYSVGVEACPAQTGKAREAIKALLREIIPGTGFSFPSDQIMGQPKCQKWSRAWPKF
jgi:hypothetical protein